MLSRRVDGFMEAPRVALELVEKALISLAASSSEDVVVCRC